MLQVTKDYILEGKEFQVFPGSDFRYRYNNSSSIIEVNDGSGWIPDTSVILTDNAILCKIGYFIHEPVLFTDLTTIQSL